MLGGASNEEAVSGDNVKTALLHAANWVSSASDMLEILSMSHSVKLNFQMASMG